MIAPFPISGVTLRIFPFAPIDSRMYLLTTDEGDDRDVALIVDPWENNGAVEFLKQAGVARCIVILTHEHYDHISGVNFLRERFPCRIVCTEACAAAIALPKKNLSQYFEALFADRPENIRQMVHALNIRPYSCEANAPFAGESTHFSWGRHTVRLVATPGHSPGSLCALIDEKVVFTGDSLLSDGGTVTRLPGGNRSDFDRRVLPFFRQLSPDLLVLPGHGDPSRFGDLFDKLSNRNK